MSKRGAPKQGEVRLITKAEHKAIKQYGGSRSMYIGFVPINPQQSEEGCHFKIFKKKGNDFMEWYPNMSEFVTLTSFSEIFLLEVLIDFWSK